MRISPFLNTYRKINTTIAVAVVTAIVFIAVGTIATTKIAFAAVLTPGAPVTSCGEIATVGLYTLSGNISTSSGPCLIITSAGIAASTTINGAGHTISGSIVADGVGAGGFNFNLKNVTVTGAISANGIDLGGCDGGLCPGGEVDLLNATTTSVTSNGVNGGQGGTILSTTTFSTSLTANGGDSGSTYGGNGGFIKISATDVDLTGRTFSVHGGIGPQTGPTTFENGTDGQFEIDYTNTINYSSILFPTVGSLSIFGPGGFQYQLSSSFSGGYITLPGQNISNAAHCNILFSGSYGLASDLNGDCHTVATSTTITGGGHTITGSVIATSTNSNGGNLNLSNVVITGLIDASAYGTVFGGNFAVGGIITITNATTTSVRARGVVVTEVDSMTGRTIFAKSNAGSITITNSSTTDLFAGGIAGSVTVTNSKVGAAAVTGTSSSITITGSTAGLVSADYLLGDTFWSGYNSDTGTVHITNSTTSDISAIAARWSQGCGQCVVHSGRAGDVFITNSVTGSITVDSPTGTGSIGGNVVVTGTNVNLSNKTISALGVVNGTLTVNYTSLTTSNLTLSPLSDILLNGPGGAPGDLGSFGGGLFFQPGSLITDVSQCNLSIGNRVYTLGASIAGDCHITADNVTIDGQGLYTITGNVVGDAVDAGHNGHTFTLENVTVNGTVSSNGTLLSLSYSNIQPGSGGVITIQNATTSDIVANSTGCSSSHSVCPFGGTVTVLNSITGTITTNGGVPSNYLLDSAGNGGTISVATSSTSSLISNGGDAAVLGGKGGSITVVNSFERIANSSIAANGGSGLTPGSGGSVTKLNSTYTGSIGNTSGAGTGSSYSTSGSGSSGSVQVTGEYSSPTLVLVSPSPAVVLPSTPSIAPSAPSSASADVSSGSVSPLTPVTTTEPSVTPASAPQQPLAAFSTAVTKVAQQVANTAVVVANSPAGKTVQAAGLFGGLLASVAAFSETAFATPLAASESVLVPARLWGLILMGLGIKKRSRRWGTVYDSVTKQPIDPAFVTVKDESGKIVAESITDIDGRYGFLLPNGIYYISAKKTNYEFPSIKLAGKSSDELYNNLYFGEQVVVREGEILDKDIPMDQKNFDWNEFTKMSRKDLLFHSRHEKPWAIASNYIYCIGLVISVITAAVHPHWYNIVILVLYVFVLLPLEFRVKRKKLGHVVDKTTHQPLSYAIIRVTAYDHETPLRSGVSDANGRYYCIVPKGKCFVDIEKKNADGSYTKIYSSSMITNKSGIINSNFAV